MKITANFVREKFLEHMKENGHAIVPSSSLVPENDPTTLFTGSGMQPMLQYLLGAKHPLGKRIADTQKSFRSQDIEEVGDNRHTTFFEMLGNWSLGDYFKEGQIDLIWDFLINKINLDPNRLYITVYKGNKDLNIPEDEVAIKKWKEKFKEVNLTASLNRDPENVGMKEGDRIFCYPDKKNWWSRAGVPENMPEGEPGGPDTEMFFDFEYNKEKVLHKNSQFKDKLCHVNCDCGRFIEIGNNVFMQYIKTKNGLQELDQKNVDFGGGLERIVAALNDDPDVFNIDIFEKAKEVILNLCQKKYEGENVYAYRVILDHIRAATFLIADGVLPGNKDREYFVRRLIRRAVRFGRNLNIKDNFTKEIANTFIEYYKEANIYLTNSLNERKNIILEEIDKEESKFRKTLENGLKEFEKLCANNKSISGKDAFNLLQTFGFPLELTLELAKERDIIVDQEEFYKLKEEHASKSRTASEGMFKGGLADNSEITTAYHSLCHLMLAGMRKVLSDDILQAGSNINSERIRFDFTFNRKIEDEEIKKIEDYVNGAIQEVFEVIIEEMPKEVAKSNKEISGAFWDKYPEIVKVYNFVSKKKNQDGSNKYFSRELCGGPHVDNDEAFNSEILKNKKFKIVKQEAVSNGVRRVKALLE